MAILGAIDENVWSTIVAEVGYDLARTYGDHLVGLHVMPEEEYQNTSRIDS